MAGFNILWVSPTLPIPVSAGNRRHLNGLIDTFYKRNVTIDFVLYGWEEEANKFSDELIGKFSRFVNLPRDSVSVMSYGDAWGVDDWVTDEMFLSLRKFILGQSYDIVIIEYVWLSKLLDLFGDEVVKVIDTHDVFRDRDKLLEKQGIEKQWFYTRELEEKKGLIRADIVLGITESDCQYFRKSLGQTSEKVDVIHCSSSVSEIPALEIEKELGDELIIGYIASSNALNKAAINLFLKELNDRCDGGEKFHFNIYGNISSHIGEYSNLKIYKKGYLGNVADFYSSIDLVVAPMIDGTGLKIKTLEAIEYKKPFIASMQATNDLPVSSSLHLFPNVTAMARFMAGWLGLSSDEKVFGTLQYLKRQSDIVFEKIKSRQSDFEGIMWERVSELVSEKSRARKLNNDREIIGQAKSRTEGENCKVSVIIPAYNTSEYIARCLDSIINDELKDFEVIVIDDGSTDDTSNIVEQYSSNDPRVKLVKQVNSGQGVARNVGIDHSVGKYLYFVDSDDYLGKNSLAFMYEFSEERKLDICSPDRPYLSARPLKYISALPGWCCFIRNDVLNLPSMDIRQPAIRSGQDGVFANMLLTQCSRGGVCESAKYFYEKRDDSTFNSLKKKLNIVPRLVEQHLDTLREFYELNDLFDTQRCRYLLFVQDETFKWRFRDNIKDLSFNDGKRIYLSIKCEIMVHLGKLRAEERDLYFSNEFIAVSKLTYEEYIKEYV